jgi:hypothetical protein
VMWEKKWRAGHFGGAVKGLIAYNRGEE